LLGWYNAGVASILVFGAALTGDLFFCLGIIGEYMIVMVQELKRRPTAVVDVVIGNMQKNPAALQINDLRANRIVSEKVAETFSGHQS